MANLTDTLVNGDLRVTGSLYAAAPTAATGTNTTQVATTAFVANTIGTLDLTQVGGSGKYIQAVSETDGKVSATEATLATSVTSGGSTAITSGAVYTALGGSGVTSTYSSTGTQAVNGTAVASAISTQVSEYSNKGLEATSDTLFAVTTTDQLNVALLVYSGRASTDANATYAILTFRVNADWSAVYSKATYLGDSRVGRFYYLADTSTKTITIGVTDVNYSNGLRVKVLECTHGYSRTAITNYTVLPGTTFSTSEATVVPSVATTWQDYNTGVGSASIPTYVAANGQVTQCTDDFVHDGEDITGNAATATHLKNPQIVETSYKAAETANYWVNFADITHTTVNFHGGGNLFTVMPKALTAIMFSFRLPHADSSTPEEFLYTSLQALSNYKVGYTLDTTSGYVYHFWIKVPQKGRVTYNCIQEYAGNVSGTLSDGTLDETPTEPNGIVYASLGGVVSNAATADSATDYSSSGGIATAFNGKFNRIVIDSSGDTYDFNDWTSEGIYYFGGKSDSTSTYTFTNCPVSTTTNTTRFNLIVFTARGRVVQTCYMNYQNDEPKIYTRSRNTGADTWTAWYRTAFRPTSAVGSSTLPIYCNSSGSLTQCGTSLAVSITGTAASCTGNAATATHLANPFAVEGYKQNNPSDNYYINFADLKYGLNKDYSAPYYKSGQNLFTITSRAYAAQLVTFRLNHDAKSFDPAEFSYISTASLSANYLPGYTLVTDTDNYICTYHFWIKCRSNDSNPVLEWNCMQSSPGTLSGTLSTGTISASSSEPTGIVYATCGGYVANATYAETAHKFANTSTIGNASTPVYINASGYPAVCTSVNADTVDEYHISVGSTVGTDSTTIYFVK